MLTNFSKESCLFEEPSQKRAFKIIHQLNQRRQKIKVTWAEVEAEPKYEENFLEKIFGILCNSLDFYNLKKDQWKKELKLEEQQRLEFSKTLEKAIKKFKRENSIILKNCAKLINEKKERIRSLEKTLTEIFTNAAMGKQTLEGEKNC